MAVEATELARKLLDGLDEQSRHATKEAIQHVFRPILANLLREPTNIKFNRLNSSNPIIRSAVQGVQGGRSFLEAVGFTLNQEDGKWEFRGSRNTLLIGDAALTLVEEEFSKRSGPTLVHSRTRDAASERENVQRALQDQVRADRQELAKREEEQARQLQWEKLQQADFICDEAFVAAVRRTIHFSGRLRNSLFEGRDFRVRRMTNGRVYACSCPPSGLECHWHLRQASCIYSHLVHLSEDGGAVVHVAPEIGYQYNSIPGTPNFGRTVKLSVKSVDEATNAVTCKTVDKPVDCCDYCQVAFTTLLV